ncbi:MAG: ankyrin repeat-containing protein [Verrucomicrobiales bacterium]|nr:ankyrin repeat-containing protein [Verrucomicrobiales bacterium]
MNTPQNIKKLLLLGALTLLSSRLIAAPAGSPIADAAEKHDHSGLKSLLAKDADVNASQKDGMTALHWAAYNEDLEAADLLVKKGANVNATNRYGIHPLSLACASGNNELITLLIKSGADVNATNRGGETVLMTAARTGKTGPVEALLEHGAKLDAKDRRGQTAMMWAAADGHAGVVQILLDAGADFQTPSSDFGFTPFFFAVREGRSEVVKLLLKAGINVNDVMQTKKVNGKSPRKGTSPLILAIENGHFELAVALLDAGADPNDERSGFTPLHTMTWVRKPPRGDGDDGDPPPIGSGNMSSIQFIEQLVKHGADVNLRLKNGKTGKAVLSEKGMTPFFMAASTDDLPFMKLLVKLGANPLINNDDDVTPLMAAAGVGVLAPTEEGGTEDDALEVIPYLLELGVDINAVDKHGETAMHGAAYKEVPRVVAMLAARGAKIDIWNQKDKYGWTPLRIAEGYRPGNFRPSFETVDAIHKVMLAAGVKPPVEEKTMTEKKVPYEEAKTKTASP